jgi:hypothetical protein
MKIFFGVGWGLNLLWIFLAVLFKGLMLLNQSSEGALENWMPNIYLLFSLIVPVFFTFLPMRIKSFFLSGRPGILTLFLSVLISFDLQPFFENDFFRYFWEGAVLREGFNPYQLAPLDLQGKVPFQYFYGIGYPELTGIYPPLTIILFSVLGVFGFEGGVFLLGLLSSYLIVKVYRDLEDRFISPHILFLVLFTLYRECVVHHHFELIAFYPFWMCLKGNKIGKFLGAFFSFHLKFVGGVAGLLLSNWGQKLFFGTAMLGSLYLFHHLGLFQSSGFQAFQEKWLFAPGFINLLMGAGIPFLLSKKISWSVFLLIFICAMVLQRKGKEGVEPFLLVFLSFFYFSPVYNAWYSLWPGLTLLFYGNRGGALYLVLSPLTYLYFTPLKDLHFFGNVIVHLGFYFSIYSFRNSLRLQS